MRQPYESLELTPQDRRQEVAAILAEGVLRLRQCRPALPRPSDADAGENPGTFTGLP